MLRRVAGCVHDRGGHATEFEDIAIPDTPKREARLRAFEKDVLRVRRLGEHSSGRDVVCMDMRADDIQDADARRFSCSS
jgi:hypothetical protein